MQGALCQLQKSLIMAALAARCHLIRIRLVNVYQNCNTTSYQDSSGTITTEFSLFGLPLQEKARLFSSFYLSVPNYTLKERKNRWHKISFNNTNTRCLNTSNSSILQTFQPFIPDVLKFQSGTSTWAITRFEVRIIFILCSL